MDAQIIVRQMAVMFLMMLTGYLAYVAGLIRASDARSIAALIANVVNPCLIVASVLNKELHYSRKMILENIFLVVLFFALLTLLSYIAVRCAVWFRADARLYRAMMIFPNLGFMGIPLVSSLYGAEAVIFVAFYIMGFNIYLYSYGLILFQGRLGGAIPWRQLCNVGMAACALAIVIFILHVQVPDFVAEYVGTVGSAAVPLSMLMVGITVAQSELKSLFTEPGLLLLCLCALLVFPLIFVLLGSILPLEPLSYHIFVLLCAMPVGSIVLVMEKEYGPTDGALAGRGIALSSVLSVLTLPLIGLLA